MGNSSSGIKEAVIFNCPALNVGDRQKSRLKPKNVKDVSADKNKIIKAAKFNIEKYKYYKNPYDLKKVFYFLPKILLKKIKKNDLIKKNFKI